MPKPVISLLTDFGTTDHYVGAMKGVILSICAGAQMVDISHDIAPYAIHEAAYTLAQAWQCFPAGTVHLIVVDPGVGTARRPIVAEAGGHTFVAPDNGVLTMALGSDSEVREIAAEQYFRQPVSRTFHGRDIFAPVAAHLASGVAAAVFGKRIEDWVRLDRNGATVLKIDHFGNVITSLRWESFGWVAERAFELRIGSGLVSHYRASYADAAPGELFAIRGSAGYLEVSMNQGSAADRLGVRTGAHVIIEPPVG
jgi:hypothetical protein